MPNETFQVNLGALCKVVSLTLHTHHFSRIWHGRAAAGRPGSVGLNGHLSIMSKLRRGAELDDPYSNWWITIKARIIEAAYYEMSTQGERVEI